MTAKKPAGNTEDLEEGRSSNSGEEHPPLHFPPDQLEMHAESLKPDTKCKKHKDRLKNLSAPIPQGFALHQPTPPLGSNEDIQQPGKLTEAAAEWEKVHHRAQHLCLAAAKQPPCVPAAVGVVAREDRTEGRKERSA